MKLTLTRLLALLLALSLCAGILSGCGASEDGDLKGKLTESETTTATEPEKESEEVTPEPEVEPATTPEGEKLQGFYVDEAGNTYFYEDGIPFTGMREFTESGFYIEREFLPGFYYFDESGIMLCSGWVEYEGSAYYFTADGTAAKPGWYEDETGWYCIGDKGRVFRDESFRSQGNEYYVNEHGYLTKVCYVELTCALEKGTILSAPNQEYLVPETPVVNCSSLTFRLSGGEEQSGDMGAWPGTIFIRTQGEWVQLEVGADKDCTVAPAAEGGFTVTFHKHVSFDAFYARHNLLGNTLELGLGNVTVHYA